MTKPFIFILLCLCGSSLYGQQSNISGYILKSNGDTLAAEIKDEVEEKYRERVLVLTGNTYKEYHSTEIAGFGAQGRFHYRAVSYVNPLNEMKKEQHFAKLLFDGAQQLFAFQRNDRPYFVFLNKDTACLLYDDQRLNSGEVQVPGNFRNQLFFYGRTCTPATKSLERINFTEGSLVGFMSDLAECDGSSSSSRSYFQKPGSRKEWIIFAGGMAFNNQSDIMFQLNQRRTFASKSKKTSLNYGLLITHSAFDKSYQLVPGNVKTYRQNSLLVQVPVFVQYNFTTGAIQPYFYAGGSVVYIQQNEVTNYITASIEKKGSLGGALLIGAGVEGRITPKFWIKADYHYDLFFHLPVLGLMYKF